MNRRELLLNSGLAALALGAARLPFAWAAPSDAPKKRILMYTRSQEYQHSVVQRKDGKLSLAEQTVTDLGAKHGFDVTCEKDGRVFLSKDFPGFDGFVFQTQGDLLAEKSQDGAPPMTADGKKALLDAVAAGKGFVGCHCASDTFHLPGYKDHRWETTPEDKRDPYIAMLGGEFASHASQQEATMQLIDPDFPGLKDVKEIVLKEEWYSLKNFAPDMHVILVQETKGMHDFDYERPPYPATWARLHEKKGRVFFTSMGHREEVWGSPIFQNLLASAVVWSLGEGKADLTPNLEKAAPKANDLPVKK
jgi:type 1 glutamine amidotransferase